MDDKSIKKLEEVMNDCLDRTIACDADDDDLFRLIDRAEALGKIINEEERMRRETDLEKEKYEDSKNWKDPKFLIPLIVPVATTMVTLVFNRNTLRMQTRDICNFEKNNTFTYSAGKGLSGLFRAPSLIKGA